MMKGMFLFDCLFVDIGIGYQEKIGKLANFAMAFSNTLFHIFHMPAIIIVRYIGLLTINDWFSPYKIGFSYFRSVWFLSHYYCFVFLLEHLTLFEFLVFRLSNLSAISGYATLTVGSQRIVQESSDSVFRALFPVLFCTNPLLYP